MSVVALIIFPLNTYAKTIENIYKTPMDNSVWTFSGNIFQCDITHKIEGFGQFKLTATPGDELMISLHADWLKLQNQSSEIMIESSAWQQQLNQPFALSTLSWQGHYAHTSRNSAAFLEALEQGLTWQVNIDSNSNVKYQVRSTPVATRSVVREFRMCKQDLLPKPFSYVRRVDLQFNTNSSHLENHFESDLVAIARYIEADANITEVLIDGHADASGDHLANLQLSKERAFEVQSRLVELGVPTSMIQVRSHGARQPIAGQATSKDRQLNRRVMVRLVKGQTLAAISPLKAVR